MGRENKPAPNRRRRLSPLYGTVLGLSIAAVAAQFIVAGLRGASVASSGAATVVEVLAWTALAMVVVFVAVLLVLNRGRHSETVKLSEMFPDAVVISTSVNNDRRDAIETVGSFMRRVKLPVEMRVVLTPHFIQFWRRDLDNPVIDITGGRIKYEVGEYVTIAGGFRCLKANVPHGGRDVEIPFFPLNTRKIWPTALPKEDLERIADHLNRIG